MTVLKLLDIIKISYNYLSHIFQVEAFPSTRMAYSTRYRETHDLTHAVLEMPTNILGKVYKKRLNFTNSNI